MNKYIMSILVLLILTTNVFAEPTPSVNYFMNQNVSLFDFGMHRLQEIASDTCEKMLIRSPCSADVLYAWGVNRIIIHIYYHSLNKNISEKEVKDICSQTIMIIRSVYGIVDGKPIEGSKSALGQYFQHIGYRNKSEKDKYYKELDNITEIIVRTPNIIAEAPLIGTEKDIAYKTTRN